MTMTMTRMTMTNNNDSNNDKNHTDKKIYTDNCDFVSSDFAPSAETLAP